MLIITTGREPDMSEYEDSYAYADTERPAAKASLELLTAAERAILEDCSKLMTAIRSTFHPNMNVVSVLAFNQRIFEIQRLIMSNAAARAYPGMYKLLGED